MVTWAEFEEKAPELAGAALPGRRAGDRVAAVEADQLAEILHKLAATLRGEDDPRH